MIDPKVVEATKHVTHILDKLDVSYVIGGSIAAIVHGPIRSTIDVDIVADLKLDHIPSFVEGLKGSFFVDEIMIAKAIEQQGSFNLIHLDSMFKIDIFIAKSRLFDQQQLRRRMSKLLTIDSEEFFWVLSAEDVILAKLDWYRLGGEVSERQWRDVLGVMKTQGNELDMAYLKQWAESLEVTDLLSRAFNDLE